MAKTCSTPRALRSVLNERPFFAFARFCPNSSDFSVFPKIGKRDNKLNKLSSVTRSASDVWTQACYALFPCFSVDLELARYRHFQSWENRNIGQNKIKKTASFWTASIRPVVVVQSPELVIEYVQQNIPKIQVVYIVALSRRTSLFFCV